MKLQLRNDFHNTTATVYAPVTWHGYHAEFQLTESQSLRVSRKLCGIAECACGKIRGPQQVRGKKLVFNWQSLKKSA